VKGLKANTIKTRELKNFVTVFMQHTSSEVTVRQMSDVFGK